MDNSNSNQPQLHLQEVVQMTNMDITGPKTKSDNFEKSSSPFLYFSVFVVGLNCITFGTAIIWVSPVTSKLLSHDVDKNPLGRPITTIELSLVGSLCQIGMVIGPVLFSKIFEKFGRKRWLNIISLLLVASLSGLAFSRNIILYYIFIFTIGILLGATNIALPMYISEITQDHNRAKMTCLIGLFLPVGNLYGFTLGPLFSVRIFTLLTTLPSLILVILSQLFLPESPTYLIMKNNRVAAEVALRKLLGNNYARAEEVADRIEFTLSQTTKNNKANIKIIWSNRAARNGFITACTLMSLSPATGLPSIMSYLEPVFHAAGKEVSGSLYSMIVGVVQVMCYFAASILVEKWGRRPLLLTSSITSVIPLFILGLYFYLYSIGSTITDYIQWIPVTGIICLIVTSVIGISPVGVAYMNDVFTSDIKATALSCIYSLSGILLAFSIFIFPIMMDTIGLAWIFWIFSVLILLGFVFIYLRVPETKGKDILEIQVILNK